MVSRSDVSTDQSYYQLYRGNKSKTHNQADGAIYQIAAVDINLRRLTMYIEKSNNDDNPLKLGG
jgi:hypothetical protein